MDDQLREELIDSLCSQAIRQILLLLKVHVPQQFVGYVDVSFKRLGEETSISYSLKYSYLESQMQVLIQTRTLRHETLLDLDLSSVKFLFQLWTCKFTNQVVDELGKCKRLNSGV